MTSLRPCEFRARTTEPATFFCRHTRVNSPDGLVSSEVCEICSVCHLPCDTPRPIPPGGAPRRPPQKSRSVARRAWDLARSLASFTADGFRTVTAHQYASRLAICDGCGRRSGNRCIECGCNLSLKARGRAFDCPLGKWPRDREGQTSRSELTVRT